MRRTGEEDRCKEAGRPRLHSIDEAFEILVKLIARVGGHAPTMREYQAALKAGSTRTAFRYMRLLEDAGKISRRKRSLILLPTE